MAVPVSQQLLEDATSNIQDLLTQDFGEAFSEAEGSAFLLGDGVKKPRGLLSYAGNGTGGTIETLPSGSASTISPCADQLVLPASARLPHGRRGLGSGAARRFGS